MHALSGIWILCLLLHSYGQQFATILGTATVWKVVGSFRVIENRKRMIRQMSCCHDMKHSVGILVIIGAGREIKDAFSGGGALNMNSDLIRHDLDRLTFNPGLGCEACQACT